MFIAPSSTTTTAIEGHSASPTSTTSPTGANVQPTSSSGTPKEVVNAVSPFLAKSTKNLATDGIEDNREQGYTILVPANVHFGGMELRVDLKLDENALPATSPSAVADAKSTAVSTGSISLSITDFTPGGVASPSHDVSRQSTSSECDEEVAKFTVAGRVSSTTTERRDAARAFVARSFDASDEAPVSSTISGLPEDVEALVDTTTTSTPGEAPTTPVEISKFAKTENMQANDRVENKMAEESARKFADGLKTFSVEKSAKSSTTELGISLGFDSKSVIATGSQDPETSSATAAEFCAPSSSSSLANKVDDASLNSSSSQSMSNIVGRKSIHDELAQRVSEQSLMEDDSQPCSSSNLEQISSSTTTAAANGAAATKKKRVATPNFCGYVDAEKGQCKQRAILSFKYCIRHILLDSQAPYRQCQHKRKPKNKKEDFVLCTNAIRIDKPDIYCSTHLIMKGMLQPKSRKGAAAAANISVVASPAASRVSAGDISNAAIIDETANSSFESSQNVMEPLIAGGSQQSTAGDGRESAASSGWNNLASGAATPQQTAGFASHQQQVYQHPAGYSQQQQQHQFHSSSMHNDTTMYSPMTVENSSTFEPMMMMNNEFQTDPYSVTLVGAGQRIRPTFSTSSTYSASDGGPTSAASGSATPDFGVNNGYGQFSRVQPQQQVQSYPPQSQAGAKMVYGVGPSSSTQPQQAFQSRLSKQHPQLAAKLLQPTSTVFHSHQHPSGSSGISAHFQAPSHQSARSYEMPMSCSTASTMMMMSPSYEPIQQKREIQRMANAHAQNASDHPSYNATPPAAKRIRRDMTAEMASYSNGVELGIVGESVGGTFVMTTPPPTTGVAGQQLRPTPLSQIPQQAAMPQQPSAELAGRLKAFPPPSSSRLNANPVPTQSAVYFRHPNGTIFQHHQQVPMPERGLTAALAGAGRPILPQAMPPQQVSSQQLAKILSKPAYIQYQTRLIESMSAQCVDVSSVVDVSPRPVKYHIVEPPIHSTDVTIKSKRNNNNNNLANGVEAVSSSRIAKIDPVANRGAASRIKKSLNLRQKRNKLRITGAFRSVPIVDAMCKIVEYHDFDSTDLFPLGYEFSDDESSSDDGFPAFSDHHSTDETPPHGPTSNRIELYLLKKQLRLESSRLVRGAKVSMPIIEAAKVYKNCVGAALRTREMNRRRETIIGVERPRHRLCQYGVESSKRNSAKSMALKASFQLKTSLLNATGNRACQRACLPYSNHCAEHILFSVQQRLFTYCNRVSCGRPILCADVTLFNGMCRAHYAESVAPPVKATKLTDSMPLTSGLQNGFSDGQALSGLGTTAGGALQSDIGPAFAGGQLSHAMPIQSAANLLGGGYGRDPAMDAKFFVADHSDVNSDDVVEDVSLASVAKDLGLNGHELTDMLERLPVDGSIDDRDIDEDEGGDAFFDGMKPDEEEGEDVSGLALGHSWADVEQFLLSEGYHGAENGAVPPGSTPKPAGGASASSGMRVESRIH